jgi:hypothetical protein
MDLNQVPDYKHIPSFSNDLNGCSKTASFRVYWGKMSQSKDESKMNRPRAISRDFSVRDFGAETEKPNPAIREPAQRQEQIRPNQSEFDPFEAKVHRREMFAAFIPATGKALTDFVRNVSTGVASALEDLKDDSTPK